MKNIVVAIEFDEELDDVVEFTANLVSDKKEIAVHVVHAYQPHTQLVDFAPYLVEAIEAYEDHLQEQSESLRKIVSKLTKKGIKAHAYMKPIDKSVVVSILEFADEKEAENASPESDGADAARKRDRQSHSQINLTGSRSATEDMNKNLQSSQHEASSSYCIS